MGKIMEKPLAKAGKWQQFIREIPVAEICRSFAPQKSELKA
jgi:hypothetical protein